jgi:predicted nucleic acid-binding protein
VIIVSNTGPLIGLAKINQLGLLWHLASSVYVPPQVHRELLAKSGPEAAVIDKALNDFIQVKIPGPADSAATGALKGLDEGERQAILLARSFAMPVLLLLDDRAGRTSARKLNQPLTGLPGLLLKAKDVGLIKDVLPMIEDVRAKGYWLSEAVIDAIKVAAHEQ